MSYNSEIGEHYTEQAHIFQEIVKQYGIDHNIDGLQSACSSKEFYILIRVNGVNESEIILYPIERLNRQELFDHDVCRKLTLEYLDRVFHWDHTMDKPIFKLCNYGGEEHESK